MRLWWWRVSWWVVAQVGKAVGVIVPHDSAVVLVCICLMQLPVVGRPPYG